MKQTGMLFVTIWFLILTIYSTPHADDTQLTPIQSLYMMKEIVPALTTVGIIWNESNLDKSQVLPKLEKAAASFGIKIVVANVSKLKDISRAFNNLIRNYHAQMLWVYQEDPVISSNIGREFMIKNAVISGVPLCAPDPRWVREGAFITLLRVAGRTRLIVNKKTSRAVSIAIPEKLFPHTEFLAAN